MPRKVESGPLRVEDGVVRLHVWVVPGASRNKIVGLHGDMLKVQVSSPPRAGRANRAVTELLEEALDANVLLVKGMMSRNKVFEIRVEDTSSLKRKLGLSG